MLGQTEHELGINMEMMTAIFSSAPLPMMLLNASGRILRWNRAAETVFGWSAAEIVGQPIPFVPPDKQEEFDELSGRLLRGESITNEELVRVRKDGSPITLVLSAAPIRDQSGAVVMTVGIMNDVTRQRTLEAQFMQSQKMEAVGRLAGGIAHDFNNVLTAIQGFAGLVLADLSPGTRMREDVEEILSAAERASSFTRQLLAFSRKQIVQRTFIEINTLISELKKLLEHMIDTNVRLNLELRDQPSYVFADRGQLEQVITNLVVNASDAIGGSGDITLSTSLLKLGPGIAAEHHATPGDYCTIAVADTGSGIPDDVLPHIFEPFFTTKDVGEGTGLGLSTVYGIVQQNGGFIRVASEPGKGTTFSIFLPDARQSEMEAAQAAAPVAIAVTTQKPTVLVVEDEPAIRQIIARILKTAGYEVVSAADPLQALGIIESDLDISVLLTDLRLPNMRGQDLVRAARAIRPDLAIVFMSGYSEEQISVDNDIPYLEKPFTSAQLLRMFTEVLGIDGKP